MFRDDNFIHLLDSKPHLLGVKNGVVDLRTGELRARLPEDMIFTVIDVTFDPEASDALIRSTVLSAMADDVEMATYIQKLLGYGCTGEVCEEIFPVFTGSGRNCKGVLVKAVQDVLGDNFFRTMNNGIIVDKNVSNLDAERGNLLGTRFALFNELKDGDKLKTNEVQLLSGGDKIPATPKYKDPMNIEPHFLCLLTTRVRRRCTETSRGPRHLRTPAAVLVRPSACAPSAPVRPQPPILPRDHAPDVVYNRQWCGLWFCLNVCFFIP